MAEHAPTPWICDSEGILPTDRDDVAVIARVPNHPENSKNWEANAAFIVEAVNSYDAMKAEIALLRSQVEIARTALGPFASIDVGIDGADQDEWFRHDGDVLTVGDFRRARKFCALSSTSCPIDSSGGNQ